MGTAVKQKAEVDPITFRAQTRRSTLRVGLLGCGVVGSEVARVLLERGSLGDSAPLTRVAVAHPEKQRSVDLPRIIVSDDAFSVVKDPDVDLVVELIGGSSLPTSLIRQALVEGKTVVTANKEVVALHGAELSALAAEHRVGFYFEGAVGGAVPMVAATSEVLAGDRVRSFHGILNGTSNFILTEASGGRRTIEQAIRLAQDLGYAELDPTDDLSGADAARKAAILASICFGVPVPPDRVLTRGIEELSTDDIAGVRHFGLELKLLASASQYASYLDVSVEPCAVERSHAFASVAGSANRLAIDAALCGRIVLEGAGAGGKETAGAVLADIARASVGAPSPRLTSRLGSPSVAGPREQPGRFIARCLSSEAGAEEVISGCLFGHGVAVDRVERLDPDQILVLTTIGERACIQRALATIEKRGVLCASLTKVFDDCS